MRCVVSAKPLRAIVCLVLSGLLMATLCTAGLAADLSATAVRTDESGQSAMSLPVGGLLWLSKTGASPPALPTQDSERVLVQLRGTPLARTGTQMRSAATVLQAQRQRAAAAIVQAVALSGAGASGAAVIRREYAQVFHGFATRIPVAARARVLALPDVELGWGHESASAPGGLSAPGCTVRSGQRVSVL